MLNFDENYKWNERVTELPTVGVTLTWQQGLSTLTILRALLAEFFLRQIQSCQEGLGGEVRLSYIQPLARREASLFLQNSLHPVMVWFREECSSSTKKQFPSPLIRGVVVCCGSQYRYDDDFCRQVRPLCRTYYIVLGTTSTARKTLSYV